MLKVIFCIATILSSNAAFAEDMKAFEGRYEAVENLDCKYNGKPLAMDECVTKTGEPDYLVGYVQIFFNSSSGYWNIVEELPYSRLQDLLRNSDTINPVTGSHLVTKIEKADATGFVYRYSDQDKNDPREELYTLEKSGPSWIYTQIIRGRDSRGDYEYFRKFRVEKQWRLVRKA